MKIGKPLNVHRLKRVIIIEQEKNTPTLRRKSTNIRGPMYPSQQPDTGITVKCARYGVIFRKKATHNLVDRAHSEIPSGSVTHSAETVSS